jgi:hypothetical protein
MPKNVRRTILKKLDKESEAIDKLIDDIMSYSTKEAEIDKVGDFYEIDGKPYRLVEIITDDPVIYIFTNCEGESLKVTPYDMGERTIHERT